MGGPNRRSNLRICRNSRLHEPGAGTRRRTLRRRSNGCVQSGSSALPDGDGTITVRRQVDRHQFRENLASRDAPPLRQWNAGIPLALELICLKALSKRASDRYQAASELRDELLTLLADGNAPSARVARPSREEESEQDAPVRPRGLRPYQEDDQEFFLRLLEGPPRPPRYAQSIRDWRAAIANDSVDSCFQVGVAYGPSGSGKTSFFRAGVVPLLPPSVVTLFADASGTEKLSSSLVRRLRHQFSDETLPDDLPAGPSRAIRLRMAGQPGRKLLLVLDQFEQRLYGSEEERASSGRVTPMRRSARSGDPYRERRLLDAPDSLSARTGRPTRRGIEHVHLDLFSTRRHAFRVLEELVAASEACPRLPHR